MVTIWEIFELETGTFLYFYPTVRTGRGLSIGYWLSSLNGWVELRSWVYLDSSFIIKTVRKEIMFHDKCWALEESSGAWFALQELSHIDSVSIMDDHDSKIVSIHWIRRRAVAHWYCHSSTWWSNICQGPSICFFVMPEHHYLHSIIFEISYMLIQYRSIIYNNAYGLVSILFLKIIKYKSVPLSNMSLLW